MQNIMLLYKILNKSMRIGLIKTPCICQEKKVSNLSSVGVDLHIKATHFRDPRGMMHEYGVRAGAATKMDYIMSVCTPLLLR